MLVQFVIVSHKYGFDAVKSKKGLDGSERISLEQLP